MGSSERGAVISGGFTGSFWLLVLGFRLAFPNMIVPFGWAATIICVGLVGLIATIGFAARATGIWKPSSPPSVTEPGLEWLGKPLPFMEGLREGLAGRGANGPIRDQLSVADAALYMTFHEWGRSWSELSAEDQIIVPATNFKLMEHDAQHGHLVIYTKRDRHGGKHVDPGAKYWENHHIDWVSEEGVITVRATDGGYLTKAYDPLVRKSDIERLYGPRPRDGDGEPEPGDNWKTV